MFSSLAPRLPPFFVLRFSISIIHGSRRAQLIDSSGRGQNVYYTGRKPKNKKTGEAWERGHYVIGIRGTLTVSEHVVQVSF